MKAKVIFFLFLTAGSFSVCSTGFSSNAMGDEGTVTNMNSDEMVWLNSEIAESRDAYSNAKCFAWTDCIGLNGWTGRIWCKTFSESDGSSACSYSVLPGDSVQCTGYNSYGHWVNIERSCY